MHLQRIVSDHSHTAVLHLMGSVVDHPSFVNHVRVNQLGPPFLVFTNELSRTRTVARARFVAMSFFYEFLEHLISKCMEDPEARRIKLNEALRENLEDARIAYVARRGRPSDGHERPRPAKDRTNETNNEAKARAWRCVNGRGRMHGGVADEETTHAQERELEPTDETLGVLDVGKEPAHVGRREETERRKGLGKVEPIRSSVMHAP